MDTNHPTYIKINNHFDRVMDEISKFEKVFQPGGKLEQAILEIDGDPSYLKDLATELARAYEALEEAHYGTLGHVVDEQLSKKKKITPSTPVDMVAEGVLDGGDEDGFMARSQLYFLARDAIKLHGIVKDQDDLAPWVSSKIAQASKDMDSVRRYTEYNAMKDAVQSMPDEAMPQEAPSVNEGTMIGGLMKYDGQPEEEYADAVARYKEFMSQPRPPSEATTDMVQGFIFDDELLDSLGEAEDGGDVLDVRHIVQSRLEDFFGPDFDIDNINEAKAKPIIGEENNTARLKRELDYDPDKVRSFINNLAKKQKTSALSDKEKQDFADAQELLADLSADLDEAKEEMCPEACCGKPVSECSCGPDCEHCDCYSQKQSKMNEGMEFDEKRDIDLQVVAKDMFKNALANAKKKVK